MLKHTTNLRPEEIDTDAVSSEIEAELGFPVAISYVVNPDGTRHILVHDRTKGGGIQDVDNARVAAAMGRAPKRAPRSPNKPPLAEK